MEQHIYTINLKYTLIKQYDVIIFVFYSLFQLASAYVPAAAASRKKKQLFALKKNNTNTVHCKTLTFTSFQHSNGIIKLAIPDGGNGQWAEEKRDHLFHN